MHSNFLEASLSICDDYVKVISILGHGQNTQLPIGSLLLFPSDIDNTKRSLYLHRKQTPKIARFAVYKFFITSFIIEIKSFAMYLESIYAFI